MDTIRTARVWAVIGIVGAVGAVLYVFALLAGFSPADETPYLIPIHLAGLAGAVALGLSGAAAGGTWRAGIAIAVAGMLAFVAAEITAPGAASDVLYGVAPLAAALGLVLAGVAALRVGRWRGWHRYVPLVAGAWIVVVILPVMVAGDPAADHDAAPLLVLGAWHALIGAMGVAVLAETRAAERVPA